MGVISYTQEFTSSVSGKRLFKALHVDCHNLIPKLAGPHPIKSMELIQGDGGAGSINITHFVEGSPIKSVKHRMDEFDAKKLTCKYTMIEGDPFISEKIDSIVNEVKFEDAGAGCCCKVTTHIHTKGDNCLKEEEIKEGKEKAEEMFKIVEAYLQANPDVYA